MRKLIKIISLVLSVIILGTCVPAQVPAAVVTENESFAEPTGATASIVSIKAKKKKITLWYKSPGANNVAYEVRIRTGLEDWTTYETTRTKLTIKKLKRKKIYTVQVRGIKLIGDMLIYSNWSKERTVKVK